MTSASAPSAPAAPGDHGFGVYVHWPFCAAKCPYCDFNSHVRHGGVDQAAYLAAYETEIAHVATLTGPQRVESIFFGGGTPSLMDPRTVGGILDALARAYAIAPGAEITLEANPTSVEADRFRGYRAAGVNRVSLGVQSLRDDQLATLGRRHTVAEARAAIALAARTFDRFTFDLIYARPGQTVAEWQTELADALALAGSHLSLYQLAIEPETPFAALHAAGKLVVPDEDAAAALYAVTQEMTAARGLPLYEISNHARPGEESRHNLLYWRYGTYAGIGPGAHGRLPIGGIRHATLTERSPEGWRTRVERDGHGLVESTPLTPAEEADEMLLMGLRLAEGVDLDRLASLTGFAPTAAAVDDLVAIGMVERTGPTRVRTTTAGRFVLDAIVRKLSAGTVAARVATAAA
jgi:oxygen-independent coproporphyrinogen-3 oxidase